MSTFDGNRKIQQLRATLRAQAARDEWTHRVANAFGTDSTAARVAANTQTAPVRKHRKPRVTFCAQCGEPIYASATIVCGIAVDSVHACAVRSAS